MGIYLTTWTCTQARSYEPRSTLLSPAQLLHSLHSNVHSHHLQIPPPTSGYPRHDGGQNSQWGASHVPSQAENVGNQATSPTFRSSLRPVVRAFQQLQATSQTFQNAQSTWNVLTRNQIPTCRAARA
ncbi:hypothetical protein PISMIDRAFT_679762 [Pisolithus microcarpus 441]|uniref:Uncharacterized protein n=1 Tax=Pisolithus microcarpus 441 TaxID=765257 RepID=A0A0C9YDL1_9AGAM|nr:hypothetical protein PISMIDRAFT_679762 [Pisolithus microcarpus 441]